jgi:hypothetical protein
MFTSLTAPPTPFVANLSLDRPSKGKSAFSHKRGGEGFRGGRVAAQSGRCG